MITKKKIAALAAVCAALFAPLASAQSTVGNGYI
ncbi:acyloxyacyl hydrolase, partial [Acinetobacter baumannii]|nr:acyloxyacyl hydrolase [Acinetobacter baumannii]